MNVGRLWRTVRHLKPAQVYGRLWFRLHRPRLDARPSPPVRAPLGPWTLPGRRAASLQAGSAVFLGESRALTPTLWDDASVEPLWRYNLHYFDDLNASDAPRRTELQRAFLERWLAENRPGRGTAWAPYPLSLRVVNWIKWFEAGHRPAATWLASLASQARWLSQRLERHLLGNHLFVNAKALLFAGLYFDGDEARGWRALGRSILEREIPEQILADGGQFELSPMYHALALEDFLDLINLLQRHPRSEADALLPTLRSRAADMLHWLRCLSHPDGRIASFNDAADGIAPANEELERYAAGLGITAPAPRAGTTHLADSGYIRVASARSVALLDVARVGPDYLPAHAHADTLSFEWSLDGRRLLVNGGTSVYGVSARRDAERGTAAHNTVQIGQHDSSEVWGGFRCGRRARPRDLHLTDTSVACSHDGYRFLPGSPIHRREWQFGDAGLTVRDRVTPAADAVARYHLAPGLHFMAVSPVRYDVLDERGRVAAVEVRAGHARVAATHHAPAFGRVLPNECLEVVMDDGRGETHWSVPT